MATLLEEQNLFHQTRIRESHQAMSTRRVAAQNLVLRVDHAVNLISVLPATASLGGVLLLATFVLELVSFCLTTILVLGTIGVSYSVGTFPTGELVQVR